MKPVDFPRDYSPQEKTPLAPQTGSCSYIARAVVLSTGTSQLLGSVVLIANTIRFLWNLAKLAFNSFAATIHSSRIETLKGRIQSLRQSGTPKEQIQANQDALEKLEKLLSFDEAAREDAKRELKENAHGFVIALLSMIPVFGLLLGGAYARAIGSGSPSDSSLERGVEGLSHHLLGRFPGLEWLGKKCFFPLSTALGAKRFKDMASSFGELSMNHFLERTRESPEKRTAQYLRTCLQSASPQIQESLEPFLQELEEKQTPLTSKDLLSFFVELARQSELQEKKRHAAEGVTRHEITVDRGDGKPHQITCHQLLTSDPTAKTMILFHGNGMVGEQMTDTALQYQKKGWNVIMVTMGGYPDSDPSIGTSEESTIQDVHAVLREIEGRGVQEIGVHGFSIGCSLAMHATQLSSKVKVAVLDKPFSSVQNVAVTLLRNTMRKTDRRLFQKANASAEYEIKRVTLITPMDSIMRKRREIFLES